MTTQLITAPAALAVSMADARLAVKIEADDTSMDTAITVCIAGITAYAEHQMQRSIINRTLRQTLDSFPDAIKLYSPPIASVSYVKYYDADNVLQTLAPDDYTVDTVSEPGYIVPAPGVTWPSTYNKINAVQVQYVAGYGATDASTPDNIRMYILAKLTEQFDADAKPNAFLDCLLDVKKVWSLG